MQARDEWSSSLHNPHVQWVEVPDHPAEAARAQMGADFGGLDADVSRTSRPARTGQCRPSTGGWHWPKQLGITPLAEQRI
jgi:hypothetical protein